jgi:C1A family cysteine protease
MEKIKTSIFICVVLIFSVCIVLVYSIAPVLGFRDLKTVETNHDVEAFSPILIGFNNKIYEEQRFGFGFVPLSDSIKPYSVGEFGDDPPAQWDWRDYNGQDWTTAARNQASCGSCWDFAAHSCLESIINIVEGDSTLDLDLSEQYILSCYSGGWGCGGSNAYYAYEYMFNNGGTITDTCFPYYANDDIPCSSKCSDWQDKLVPITGYGYSDYPSRNDIKNKIVNDGPVCVSFSVYSDFYDGSPSFDPNGVYQHTFGSYQAGHQIAAVGFVDTPGNPNYDGYWICKNSWGAAWGPWDNGFFGIAYGECNIDEDIVWVEYSSTAPDTSITSGPSGTIDYDDVTFEWIGSDGNTPTADLVYSYFLEGYDSSWSSWTSITDMLYNDLPHGAYTFKVKAKDEAGIPDYTPSTRSFNVEIEPTPLLSYNPNSFDFGLMLEGQTDSTTFDIWNSGSGTLTYSLSKSCGWITINPTSGNI